MILHFCKSRTLDLRQEDNKSEANLDYEVSSRPA